MNVRTFPVVLASFAAFSTYVAEPPVPQFRHVTLDAKIQIGYGLAIADVDGDKRVDVLLADRKQFVWYRNPGGEKARDPAAWTKHLLAENLTEKDNVCLAAQDIDGDGKCEIAVGAEWNPADTEKSGALFYLVAPADRTQPWTPIKFPSVEPTTHRMRWLKLGERKWGLVVVPLHGRGNKNGEGAPVKILIYHPPSDPRNEWNSEIIADGFHMTHNFAVMAGRRGELISASGTETSSGVLFSGREGFGLAVPNKEGGWDRSGWTRSTYHSSSNAHTPNTSPGVGELRPLTYSISSFIRTGLATVEPMHGNELVFYKGDKSFDGPLYDNRIVLTDKLVDGHALACGDLLKIGSDQIVVGWRGKPGLAGSTIGVAIWTTLDATGEKWRETVIDPDGMACEDLQLADLDGDGRLDIVASGRATKNVKLYFNDTPVAP